ncbi:hypothetical protein Q9189_005456 [Teloschistes chrysophthalmus]
MTSLPATHYEQRAADPDGDIEFILDDPNGTPSTLRVSGKVLSISSPVFKALIRPRFQEGQALTASQLLGLAPHQTHATGSRNTDQTMQPVKIPLPDDDAQAMTWLCHALHLRGFLDHKPDLALVERVAILSKKYQCAQALGPWTSVWLKKWNKTRNNPRQHGTKDHFQMLCIANALDDDVQFFKTCQDIIRYTGDDAWPSTETMSASDDPGFQMLPEGFVGSLKARRDRAISVIRETIEGAIDPLINPNLTEQEARYKGRRCPLAATSHDCQRAILVAHFFTELARIGLWPLSRLNMFGMGQIHDALRHYRSFEESETFIYGENLPDCRCAFYSMDHVIKNHAVNTAQFLLESRFCLAQARAGRFDVQHHMSCDLQGDRVKHNHED